MAVILTLVRKDIANFRRNRALVVVTFVVPIVLIYIFGWVFGLNQKDNGPTGIRLGVVNASTNPGAVKLVDALKAESAFHVITTTQNPDKTKRPLTEDDVRRLIHDDDFRYAVVIPADVVRTDRIGLHLKILSDPRNDIEAQMVNGLLQKTLFSNVPELLGQSLQARARSFLGDGRFSQFNRGIANTVASAFGGDPAQIQQTIESGNFGLDRLAHPTAPADPTLRRLDAAPAAPATVTPASAAAPAGPAATPAPARDFFSRIIKIDTEQVVGKNVKSPAATRMVGGWAIMFLLFAVSGGAAAFFDEANSGVFQRILSAPVTRAQLLWSRFLYGIILGLVQLLTMFLAGRLMYGIDVFGHLGNLVAISIAAAAACSAFGMLIAALAPNAAAASGLSTLVVLVMSATGGAWFPMSLMPEFMQKIGKFSLVYWSMEGFLQVLWAESTFVELLPILGVLLGITLVVMVVAIWRLNKKAIFA
jgi:ABC-2 type transport system permease protein